jgi:large subunit ribosomal protein L23
MSVKGNIHEVLRSPRLTEKSTILGSEETVVVFEVAPKANKKEIKNAVEKLFEVKVTAVRTMNYFGKGKKRGLANGKMHNWKKAYVSLAKGSRIDVIEGL